MTVSKHGKDPGVVAFANDAHLMCVPCAMQRYGPHAINQVIEGIPGWERYTDHEGNPLHPILYGDEDLHGQHCDDRCVEWVHQGHLTEEDTRLCDEDCACYDKGEGDFE